MIILHITTHDAWAAAGQTYHAESLETEGFIHCSTPLQVVEVANNLYRGQEGLVLLIIDEEQVTPEIRYEPPEPGSELRFPHIYGPLNRDAVLAVVGFPPVTPEGSFALPEAVKAFEEEL